MPVLMLLRSLMRADQAPLWGIALIVGLAAGLGWLWFGALLIGWHTVRGTRWRLEPGEWLVLGVANTAAVLLLLGYLESFDRWSTYFEFTGFRSLLRTYERLCPALIAAVFVAAAIAQGSRPWWCGILLIVAAAILSIYLPIMDPRAFSERPMFEAWRAISALIVGLLIAAVVTDRRRELRHWLHWSGVAVTGLAFGTFVTMYTLSQLLGW